jgi:hypothetical protein
MVEALRKSEQMKKADGTIESVIADGRRKDAF